MTNHERGQLIRSAAEFYDSQFVPALCEPWAPIVVDAAEVSEGNSVLDVACGTGVVPWALTRATSPRLHRWAGRKTSTQIGTVQHRTDGWDTVAAQRSRNAT